MKIIKCDRCNKEIKNNYWTIDIYEQADNKGLQSTKGVANNMRRNLDKMCGKDKEYCRECAEEIKEYIERGNKTNENT